MKKSIILIVVLINVITCFSESNLFQHKKKSYRLTDMSKVIERDILKLKKKSCTDFLVYINNCFFTACEKMKPASLSSGTYFFLFYKKKGLNILRLYNVENYEYYSTAQIKGYNPELFWNFFDTCNVYDPKCNDMVTDDGCSSILYCYKDTIVKKYYFSNDLLECQENSYTQFINLVSESVKQYVFVSNRYDVKKIYSRRYIKMLYDYYKKRGCID